MSRPPYVLWESSSNEVVVRRSTGQIFRFSGERALAGGHQVFATEAERNNIVVLTGPKGARRPTRKVRFSETGMYRGNSGL